MQVSASRSRIDFSKVDMNMLLKCSVRANENYKFIGRTTAQPEACRAGLNSRLRFRLRTLFHCAAGAADEASSHSHSLTRFCDKGFGG